MIVDCAHYKDGKRQHEGKLPLEEAAAKCPGREPGEPPQHQVDLELASLGRPRRPTEQAVEPEPLFSEVNS